METLLLTKPRNPSVRGLFTAVGATVGGAVAALVTALDCWSGVGVELIGGNAGAGDSDAFFELESMTCVATTGTLSSVFVSPEKYDEAISKEPGILRDSSSSGETMVLRRGDCSEAACDLLLFNRRNIGVPSCVPFAIRASQRDGSV
jgi:hypothetical protein